LTQANKKVQYFTVNRVNSKQCWRATAPLCVSRSVDAPDKPMLHFYLTNFTTVFLDPVQK